MNTPEQSADALSHTRESIETAAVLALRMYAMASPGEERDQLLAVLDHMGTALEAIEGVVLGAAEPDHG